MDLGNKRLKLIIADRHIVFLKTANIRVKLENSGQEVMYYSKYFNSNYMEFVGYSTCE